VATGLVFLIILIAIVIVAGAARLGGSQAGGEERAPGAVRRVLFYGVMFGVLVVAAVGLSGLLGALFERDTVVAETGAGDLARGLAFTLVGGPVFVAMWRSAMRRMDGPERRSLAWALYLNLALAVSLVVALTSLANGLIWLFGLEGGDPSALGSGIVWSAALVWHRRALADPRRQPTRLPGAAPLFGSGVGLVTLAVGGGALVARLLEEAYERLFTQVIAGGGLGEELGRLAIWTALGGAAWFWYWIRHGLRLPPGTLRSTYLLVAGVLGGMITAVAAAGRLLYAVLEWPFGEPLASTAAGQFRIVPSSLVAAGVGVAVWGHHRSVVAATPGVAGSEVERASRYLLAGLGMVATAGGVGTVVNALLESVARPLAERGGPANTLLVGITLLAVGGPLWWTAWRRVARADAAEARSPSRRVYLSAVFGLSGIVALVSLLILAFRGFEALLDQIEGSELVDRIRVAAGFLVATAWVAWYHGVAWRHDRGLLEEAPHRLRRVILVAGGDTDGLAAALHRATGAGVTVWRRGDRVDGGVSAERVAAVLAGVTEEEVLVVAGPDDSLEVIPVER
jgi:hypothetical protein